MNDQDKNKGAPAPPRSQSPRRYTRWLVDAALIAAVYFGVQLYQSRDAPSGPAPPVAGSLLSGQAMSMADYAGRPVLVHFWATWCAVCRVERGSIEAIARDHSVVAIASQSGSPAEVEGYVREHGILAPVMVDEDGVLAARFGVRAFPTSFVVDGKGNIYDVEVGYTTEWGLRLRLWWAGL